MNNELILSDLPKSIISEDIRTIRTNLEFSLSDFDEKVLMITSSLPSEGKTFISSNLAIALAKNDYKVILIDCDLRCGRLHKMFKVTNKNGLSNFISNYDGNINLKKYSIKTDIKGLTIITRGTVPPNPSELLSSNKFKALIRTWNLYKKEDISYLKKLYCFICYIFNAIKRRI